MAQLSRDYMKKYISRPHAKLSLMLKMTLLIAFLTISVLGVSGIFFYQLLGNSLEEQIGDQALSVSRSVAAMPDLAETLETTTPERGAVQEMIAPVLDASEAEFIVVGDREEIRYSHPNMESLGLRMIGEDNERALQEGLSYISRAEGSLGPSIRGKSPLYNENDEIVGVVSVGFLMEDVQGVVQNYGEEMIYMLILVLLLGTAGALMISFYIKKVLFGLEPEEISYLLLQKETILQSAHEGIIAVNNTGEITLLNKAAQRLLSIENEPLEEYLGVPVQSLLPDSRLPEVLDERVGQYDEEMKLGAHIVVANRVPLFEGEMLVGAVSTFRNKTEIEKLTKELARVREYAEGLRAQTHEFSNKLHTISGLLQLNEREEAVQFIQDETKSQETWIQRFIDQVADPMISAILLGKLNQAHELGVELTISRESVLRTPLSKTARHALVTALGNIMDNAIDAVKNLPEEQRLVSIFFTDIGEVILFEIEDNGEGITAEEEQRIYEQGYSTKEGEDRGFGLALSKRLLENAGGSLSMEEAEGTCFLITLPKEGESEE